MIPFPFLSQIKSHLKLDPPFTQVMENDSSFIWHVQVKTLWKVYCNTDTSGNEQKDSHPVGWLQTVIKTLIM